MYYFFLSHTVVGRLWITTGPNASYLSHSLFVIFSLSLNDEIITRTPFHQESG